MSKNKNFFSSLFIIIFGNFIYALAVKLFILPGSLITGGSTGIALAVNHVVHIPLTAFLLVFNILMLLAGLIVLGKKFALTTIVSSFAYPLSLELLNRVLSNFYLTKDPLLCSIFAGFGVGIALGIVIRSGASTGGMDIPPLILNHYFRIPVSVSLYVFDCIILLMQAPYHPKENILYAILHIITYTVILNKVLLSGTARIEVKLISPHSKEICEEILGELDLGVTLLSAQGGYNKDDMQVILSVVSNRDLPRIEKMVHRIDPTCFLVISQVTEVHGRGFTIKR